MDRHPAAEARLISYFDHIGAVLGNKKPRDSAAQPSRRSGLRKMREGKRKGGPLQEGVRKGRRAKMSAGWTDPGDLSLRVIGRIRTPFLQAHGTPIQPAYAQGAEGTVLVEDPYAAALDDLEGFDRLWLVYWMDRIDPGSFRPRVVPYRDTREHGLFATRSPCRPNPIGLSVVRLVGRDGAALRVADVDILDDTPLLDIKPYVPAFDAHPTARAGWFETRAVDRKTADDRFHRAQPEQKGGPESNGRREHDDRRARK